VATVLDMGLKQRKEEAEAVLDSAEMTLETFGTTGSTARDLESKIAQLEQELQDPDSESSLNKLINEVRDLMDDLQQQGSGDMMPEEPGGPGPGGMPDDEMPPI